MKASILFSSIFSFLVLVSIQSHALTPTQTLFLAIKECDAQQAQKALSNGAHINALQEEQTPLMLALDQLHTLAFEQSKSRIHTVCITTMATLLVAICMPQTISSYLSKKSPWNSSIVIGSASIGIVGANWYLWHKLLSYFFVSGTEKRFKNVHQIIMLLLEDPTIDLSIPDPKTGLTAADMVRHFIKSASERVSQINSFLFYHPYYSHKKSFLVHLFEIFIALTFQLTLNTIEDKIIKNNIEAVFNPLEQTIESKIC